MDPELSEDPTEILQQILLEIAKLKRDVFWLRIIILGLILPLLVSVLAILINTVAKLA